MRRCLLLLIVLCVHFSARGQTNYEYYYWFDDNQSILQSGSSAMGALLIQADVSHLNESMHAIHIQVRDKDGNYSSPFTRYFVKMAKADTMLGHYWFDNDIDHIFSSPNIQGIMDIDVSHLTDGLHTLHFVVDAGMGTVSQTETNHFIKVPQTNGVDHMDCICIIDDELYKQERVAANGGVVIWDLDVSQLSQGLHRMSVQVVTPSGTATNTYEAIFLREPTYEEFANMKCVYAIDGAEFNSEAGTLSNGTFHFDLDVSRLENGLHRIAYMLSDGKGITTKTMSQFFMKTPLGGNGITEYWYWLNEQDESQAKRVSLPERQNPFSLIMLLPVESHPIRSKLFQFRMEQDKPVIYAKNDIHLRFFDASGRFTDATKQYVDESVKQEVKDVELLESGIRATTAKPKENTIKWYKVTAERGDSLQFKLDRAATIQLFSPSGKEVYSVSGAESVKWNGLHVWESGTFYLALHDVTASNGNTASVDYNHIDKYAVLRQNVCVVGNGGCSTITFEGNGFRDLYAVDLYNDHGDSIKHIYIENESDATTSVVFDFSDVPLGKYNALFHFAQEDKVFTKLITVEEARNIELATTVSYPASFLRGTSTTYTVRITNKGNMTAYSVPMELKIRTKSKNNIDFLSFGGFLSSFSTSDELINIGLETEEIEQIQQLLKLSGDLSQFIFYRDSVDNIDIGVSFILLELPPNSSKDFTVTIKTSTEVYLSAYMTTEWYPLCSSNTSNYSREFRKSPVGEWVCCYLDRMECIADGVAQIVNNIKGVPPIINCAYQFGNTLIQTGFDIGCSDGGNIWDKFHSYTQSRKGEAIGTKLLANAIDCLTGQFNKIIEDLRKKLRGGEMWEHDKEILALIQETQNLRDNIFSKLVSGIATSMAGVSCYHAFRTQKPGCPPNPNGGGGSSNPQPPSDPNDIFGYLSEAGSKFMTDEVAKVNYTIEFENDTTFAQASAHTIIIRDTLDSHYFDLKSFLPTSMKIGEHETFLDETADVKTADGVTSFLKTIDMRPDIDAIAQVEGEYSQQTGIATWTFTSLNPMTMEPTDELMQGILPVNYNGTSGIGEVMFEVGVKPNKGHGTEVNNRASIIFDYEDAILTPTWTNIVDRIEPVSSVKDVTIMNDSTAVVTIDAFDNLSGCWRYDVYVQYGEGSAWWKAAENVSIDTTASVKIYDGINHGFYVVATDSAGNVEKKNPVREAILYNGKTTLIETPSQTTIKDFYDLQGRKVDGILKKNEIYIMTDGDKKKSQKVVKK